LAEEYGILITGGAGFIGANLLRSLPRLGRHIRVLDDLSSGRAQDVNTLPVELIVGDIRDRRLVDEAMAGVQIVVCLAAHTGVVQSVENPADDMSVNVAGTLNLLEAAVRHKVERFIFASTGGAIVGEVEPPVHEDMPPRPFSPTGPASSRAKGIARPSGGATASKPCPCGFPISTGLFPTTRGASSPNFSAGFRPARS
jgi:UDP-glucose 4-epimerase